MKRKIIAILSEGLMILAAAAGIASAGFFYWNNTELLHETNETITADLNILKQLDASSMETKLAEVENSISERKFAEEAAKKAADQAAKEAAEQEEKERETITDLKPGWVIKPELISEENLDQYFKIYEILEGDAVCNRIIGKSYQQNDQVALSDLRYLKVLHYNFNGEIQVGELIVNAQLAEDFISAFKRLYDAQYEIQSLYLIDNYWTGNGEESDTASIEVNNSSAFCYRDITGGGSLSNHAFGCAIDINSQQNPYVTYDENGVGRCSHENAKEYLDRNSGLEHVITHEDLCYQVFTDLGFTWGGDWDNPKDYQHFEKKVN